MQKVFLTGGTGFLGSHVLRGLLDREKANVCLLLRKSSNLSRIQDLIARVKTLVVGDADLEAFFAAERFNVIIHCATNYGRAQQDPLEILETNLILPLKLLQLGKKSGVSCFINTDTILDKGVSSYSMSKSQFKDWLQFFSEGMACVNIGLEHFYGSMDDSSKFVSYVVQSLLAGVPSLDLTEGKQKRDFIYVDDAVDAFLRIYASSKGAKSGFHHYEVGSGRTVEIREFVRLVDRLVGLGKTRLNFGVLPYRKTEVMESKLDISKIQGLGWSSKISLEEGLSRMIAAERGKRVAS